MAAITTLKNDRDCGPAPRRAPLRRCLVTNTSLPRENLLRFVVGPGDEIVPDVANDLPGRGLWLTPRREIVEAAAAKGLFARVARRPVSVPSDLADRVDRLLTRRCLDFLGLARRSGAVAAGHDAVTDWLRQGQAAVLLTASDGAESSRRKIARLGRAVVPGMPVIGQFTAAELGEAIGRDGIVHVALTPGRLAARLAAESARLAEYRGTPLEDVTGNENV